MKKLTLIVALFALNSLFSQEKYNLPPGSVVQKKSLRFNDISSKINDVPNYSQIADVNQELFKDLSIEKLDEMKELNSNSYDYYSKAAIYFQGLSDKVKALYNAEELWYIYQFDASLTETLKTIK
jgi:hypothetical protein